MASIQSFVIKAQALFQTHPLLLVLLLAWVIAIKGVALWRAAQREEKVWFIVLLIVNTLGVLEVIYLLIARSPVAIEEKSSPTIQ